MSSNSQRSALNADTENPRQDAQPLPNCEADMIQSSNKVGLPALLRELAELAPERFSTRHRLYDEIVFLTWLDVPGEQREVGHLSLSDWYQRADERAVLQAALQALCDSRGWSWSVESALAHPHAERRFYVHVWRPEALRPADYHLTAHAPTAPLALAAAVLAALRAERGA